MPDLLDQQSDPTAYINSVPGLSRPAATQPAASPPVDYMAERQKLSDQMGGNEDKEAAAIRAGMEKRNALMAKHTPIPKDPNLGAIPDPPKQDFTDPIKAFQNPAVVLATLGSLFSRAPMTAAMNAGGAAMEAYHKGEAEVFVQKRDEWKQAMEKAREQNKTELEKYNVAWKKHGAAVAEKMAQMQAIAASVKDEVMLAALASKRPERLDQMLEMRQKVEDGLKLSTAKFEEQKENARIRAGEGQHTGLSEKSETDAAWRYIKTGQLPTIGWGKTAAAARTSVLNKASKLAEENNIDMAEQPKKWQKFKGAQVAIQRFESGPQGNVIRSLNVAIDHLSTLDKLATALQNNDLKQFNRLAQQIAEETGQPAPTNLDAAKGIIGPEIIKAIGIAGAGTKEERELAANAWNRARSPAQLAGATQTVMALLAGQLRGLKLQFKTSTQLGDDDFNSMLLPETINQLGRLGGNKEEAVPDKVYDGKTWHFKGGDQYDRKNWVAVD